MRQRHSTHTQQGQVWVEHSLENTTALRSQGTGLCQHAQLSAPATLDTTMLLEL